MEHVGDVLMRRALEASEPCRSAVGMLEGLVLTHADLPDSYRQTVKDAFAALRGLDEASADYRRVILGG